MHENELLVLFLGSVVLVLIFGYRRMLRQLPQYGWLLAAYSSIWLAWLATNLEHLMLAQAFNLLEHGAYLASALLLMIWCGLGKLSHAPSGGSGSAHD